jgi:hypothetical protein
MGYPQGLHGLNTPEYRITRTSLHDLRIPAETLALPAAELADHLAANLGPQTSSGDYFVILAPRGGELIRYVGTKTRQAPQHAAARIRDQAYRLAAIERLIAHVASSSPDRTASLVASAIHEIARGARTPEDALTLLAPEWATALSGLTR